MFFKNITEFITTDSEAITGAWWKIPPLQTKSSYTASEAMQNNNIVSKILYEFTQFQGARKGALRVYLVLYRQSTFEVRYKRAL